MKIHVSCVQGINEDWGRMDVDKVDGDMAELLAEVVGHLVMQDGKLVLELRARNTSNKPHVTFDFAVEASEPDERL
jgi:hypothetical protein